MENSFIDKLQARWKEQFFLCVGLDPVLERFPQSIKQKSIEQTIVAFNSTIIDATSSFVCAYKPNSAFYEAYGVEGISALKQTVDYIKQRTPEIPVILDAKRGDIENTNQRYVKFAFDELKVDAYTVHSYMGKESLKPFLKRKNKGIFVLVRTSNPGAGEFQDLLVDGQPLYLHIAKKVADEWNQHGNCGLVVGAPYPAELKKVREVAGDIPILIPGIGAQGGDVSEIVHAGKNKQKNGIIINSSRSLLYGSSGTDFVEVVRRQIEELDAIIKKNI